MQGQGDKKVEIGAQVSTAGGLERALQRGGELASPVIQIFATSPRRWAPPAPTPEQVEAFCEAARTSPVRATFCHASYLINLATSDELLYERSVAELSSSLALATRLGAKGLVLHLGSHRGAGFCEALSGIASGLVRALDATEETIGEPSCALLLENAAGAGGTVGSSIGELSRVLEASGGDPRLGLCLDTQHLFASGIAFSNEKEVDRLFEEVDRSIGLARLCLIHLNDSKVGFGAQQDRHENLGVGLIGKAALGALLSAPCLRTVPVVLEVPGEGHGPRRRDLASARAILRAGVARRAATAAELAEQR